MGAERRRLRSVASRFIMTGNGGANSTSPAPRERSPRMARRVRGVRCAQVSMPVTVSALPTAAPAEGGQRCSLESACGRATTCRSNLASLRATPGTFHSVIHHLAHIEMRRAANGAETSSDAVLPHRQHLTRRGTVSPISKRDIPETANPLQVPRKDRPRESHPTIRHPKRIESRRR